MKWTLELAITKAKECKRISDFRNKYDGAYRWLRRYNYEYELDIIFPKESRNKIVWDLENSLASARKCASSGQFIKKYNGAWKWLKRNGYEDDLLKIFPARNGKSKLNLDICLKRALKCNTVSELKELSEAYMWLKRNGYTKKLNKIFEDKN